MFNVRTNSEETRKYLRRVQYAFKTNQHLPILNRVAMRTLAQIVRATPKGYTGLTRQKWTVVRQGDRGYVVTNPLKVMHYLEFGTAAHGPKFAKALFIPKNRKAAIKGTRAIPSLTYGVDYFFTKSVRGITAMGIVKNQRKVTSRALKGEMQVFLRRILAA